MGIPERRDPRLRPIVILGLVAVLAVAACAGSSTSAPYPAGADDNGEGAGPPPAPPAAPTRGRAPQRALPGGGAAVAAVGGYVGASEESNADDRAVATITYRIPATRWEAV